MKVTAEYPEGWTKADTLYVEELDIGPNEVTIVYGVRRPSIAQQDYDDLTREIRGAAGQLVAEIKKGEGVHQMSGPSKAYLLAESLEAMLRRIPAERPS